MERTDFCSMPVGLHGEIRIAVCPKCGRHGRVQIRLGGGRVYDHVGQLLDTPVAGVRVDILEWCEGPEPGDW